MEKWQFLDQNHWLTNFKIISVFRLVEVFIFIGQKVVFSFQNIVKHIFLAHIAKKKKLEKCQFFASQNVLFLQPRNGFFVLKYHKRHFPDLYCLAKTFLEQNHGLTTLEKCQFFDSLNFLFLLPRKAFFRSRISQNTFLQPILPKKKVQKMAIFGPKPFVNPFGKTSIFGVF